MSKGMYSRDMYYNLYKKIMANDDLHLLSQTCTESVMGNSTTPQEVLHMSFYVDPIYVPPL
jgi:hypothetical protein